MVTNRIEFSVWSSQAIGVILQREQEKIASMQRSAYLLLEETKRKLQEEEQAVQNELRVRELQEERERRKLRATARDTPMNDALADFEEKVGHIIVTTNMVVVIVLIQVASNFL